MDSVKLTYDVPVPIDAAFYLFVEEISQWWPRIFTHDPARYCGVSIDARPGGAVSTVLDDDEIVWGEVEDVQPPWRISWRQWWRQQPENPSLITVRFTPVETGARLHFVHGGWNYTNAYYRHRFPEWPLILANYVAHARAHARGTTLVRRVDRGVA